MRGESYEHDRRAELGLEVLQAVAVSISPRKRAQSQPARFLIHGGEADLRVGLVEGSRPPSCGGPRSAIMTTASITSLT